MLPSYSLAHFESRRIHKLSLVVGCTSSVYFLELEVGGWRRGKTKQTVGRLHFWPAASMLLAWPPVSSFKIATSGDSNLILSLSEKHNTLAVPYATGTQIAKDNQSRADQKSIMSRVLVAALSLSLSLPMQWISSHTTARGIGRDPPTQPD